jgi:hypothetical protein
MSSNAGGVSRQGDDDLTDEVVKALGWKDFGTQHCSDHELTDRVTTAGSAVAA